MKKRLILLFGMLLLVVGGFAAAASVSVSAERDVNVKFGDDLGGSAIVFDEGDSFDGVLHQSNGVVTFDLNKAIKDNNFNRDAKFQIGSKGDEVFSITNNLDNHIVVNFKNNKNIALYHNGSLVSPTGTGITIEGEGKTQNFYFVIKSDSNVNANVSGTLTIQSLNQ